MILITIAFMGFRNQHHWRVPHWIYFRNKTPPETAWFLPKLWALLFFFWGKTNLNFQRHRSGPEGIQMLGSWVFALFCDGNSQNDHVVKNRHLFGCGCFMHKKTVAPLSFQRLKNHTDHHFSGDMGVSINGYNWGYPKMVG